MVEEVFSQPIQTMGEQMSDVAKRITEYLTVGGFFNPELMEHDKVRDLLIDCRTEIERLREDLAKANEQIKHITKGSCNGIPNDLSKNN